LAYGSGFASPALFGKFGVVGVGGCLEGFCLSYCLWAIAVLVLIYSFGVVAKRLPQLNVVCGLAFIIMLFSLFFFWINVG